MTKFTSYKTSNLTQHLKSKTQYDAFTCNTSRGQPTSRHEGEYQNRRIEVLYFALDERPLTVVDDQEILTHSLCAVAKRRDSQPSLCPQIQSSATLWNESIKHVNQQKTSMNDSEMFCLHHWCLELGVSRQPDWTVEVLMNGVWDTCCLCFVFFMFLSKHAEFISATLYCSFFVIVLQCSAMTTWGGHYSTTLLIQCRESTADSQYVMI